MLELLEERVVVDLPAQVTHEEGSALILDLVPLERAILVVFGLPFLGQRLSLLLLLGAGGIRVIGIIFRVI